MQLKLFRCCLIISLLASNEAKLKIRYRDSLPENRKLSHILQSKPVQNLIPSKNKYRDTHLSTSGQGNIAHINPKLSSSQLLAKKLANEALKSPKIREKIEQLRIVKRNTNENIQEKTKKRANIIRTIKATKENDKPSFETFKRKKRKCDSEHGLSSDFDSSKDDSSVKVPTTIHRKELINKPETENSNLQEIPSTDDITIRKARKVEVKESMLERIMQTTTKDPNKKKPEDPGMEYSDYYNDGDENDSEGKLQAKDDSKAKLEQVTNNEFSDLENRCPPYASSRNKVKVNQDEKNQEEETNSLQEEYASLNGDDEFSDDSLEDENDENGSNTLISDSNQDQNQLQQEDQIYNQNPLYVKNPYFQIDPKLIKEPNGLTDNLQLFHPNQYNEQFPIPSQNPLPSNKPLNQIPETKFNFDDEGRNGKINHALDSIKESQQLYPSIEATSLHPTISELMNLSSTEICTSTTDSTRIDSSAKLTSALTSKAEMKRNLKTIQFVEPLISEEQALESDQQQLNSRFSSSDTQVIADQILSKIVDELEDLKATQSKKSLKEGRPCKLSGSWETSKAGVKLNMKVVNSTIMVTTEKLQLLQNHERILNTTWNLSGQIPFREGGPFSLTGVNNRTKTLAVFVGSCRVCHGIDTIEGIWILSREPHGCQDFQMATGIYNDIFRRTRYGNSRRKEHKKSKTIKLPSSTGSSTKIGNTAVKV